MYHPVSGAPKVSPHFVGDGGTLEKEGWRLPIVRRKKLLYSHEGGKEEGGHSCHGERKERHLGLYPLKIKKDEYHALHREGKRGEFVLYA